ncbi:MAG: hypothetical protein M3494_18515, partial [Actinomycetota bacterium]|nr:hypothetical protein [Actinomycetota bacterium]
SAETQKRGILGGAVLHMRCISSSVRPYDLFTRSVRRRSRVVDLALASLAGMASSSYPLRRSPSAPGVRRPSLSDFGDEVVRAYGGDVFELFILRHSDTLWSLR